MKCCWTQPTWTLNCHFDSNLCIVITKLCHLDTHKAFARYTWVSQYQTFILQQTWYQQPSSRTLTALGCAAVQWGSHFLFLIGRWGHGQTDTCHTLIHDEWELWWGSQWQQIAPVFLTTCKLVHFRCLQQESGIPCLLMSGTRLHCSLSAKNPKLNCSGCLILPIDSQTLSAHYTTVLHIQCRLFIAELHDIWHFKVVLQQKCESATLIIFTVNK